MADLTWMRERILQVLGVGLGFLGCRSAGDTEGLVVVPMQPSPEGTAAERDAGDAATADNRVVHEPGPPHGDRCERVVDCFPSRTSPPSVPFPPPYERCEPNPIGEPGQFSPRETDARRATEPEACCYVSFDRCSSSRRTEIRGVGRPLRSPAGDWVLAPTRIGSGWALTRAPAEQHLVPDRGRAEQWAHIAAAEHASVAEFGRVAWSLLALGAPSALVEGAHRAALEEIGHARTAFGIASAYAGRELGPGRLDVAKARHEAPSFVALAQDTLRDGCYGELAGAIDLWELARGEPECLADPLERMAQEEVGHGELAWRILRFCLEQDARVAGAIEAVLPTLPEDPTARLVVRPCALALVSALARWPRAGDCAREA